MGDPPVLDIQLLGGFCLNHKYRQIRQGITKRMEVLLAYLLLHRDVPVPRQRLAFLFWPETSEKQAYTNLRNLLYKLRTVWPDADSYLYIDQSVLHWRPSLPFNLDVDRFLSLVNRSTSIPGLENAVQSYRGDFLPDCYDDWVQSVRENLRRTFVNTLENLVRLLAEENRPRESLQYAQRLLTAGTDP